MLARQQLHFQFALQQAYLSAQGRLGDERLACGIGKTAGFDNGDQITQLFQSHRDSQAMPK
ncbi:hypothetical protein D3C81_2342590 [compost metagenome]